MRLCDRSLRRRIADGVARYPNATNPWARRLLLGRECPGAAGLMPAPGVTWVHADVADHLNSVPAAWYDAVSLSNVLDGPPSAYVARLRDALRHAVRPGGPVVLRTFGDRSPLPGRPLADRSLLWGAVTQIDIS
jgi:hypothetical protein